MVDQNRKFSLWLVFFALIPFELIAWFLNYIECRDPAQLLHPQLLPDLLFATIFYSTSALTWYFLLKRHNYSLLQIFFLQGLIGIIVEQGGVVIISLISNPASIFLALFVLAFYGSPALLAYYFSGKPSQPTLKQGGTKIFIVSLVLLLLATGIGGLIISQLVVHIPRFPICLHPLI